MSICKYLLRLLCFLTAVLGPLRGISQPSGSPGQSTPGPQQRLSAALSRWQTGQISDTIYLHAVDSVAPQLLNDDSLVQELSTYRQLAFSNNNLGKYRVWYYRYMAVFSLNKHKYGSAIYFSERNNEESVALGLFEKGGIPHSDLFAISVYDIDKDYTRLLTKYSSLEPQLDSIPAIIAAGKFSGEQGFVALTIMGSAGQTYFKIGDALHGNKCLHLYEQILAGIDKYQEKFKAYLMHYYYGYHMICYQKARYADQADSAERYLQMAISEVESPGYLKNMRATSELGVYADAFDFYFDRKRTDSARRYLGLMKQGQQSALGGFEGLTQSVILEYENKLLAASGRYDTAYRALWKLYQKKDSAFYAVSADKDNNLYALEEAEYARNGLVQSEARQRKTEHMNFILLFVISLLAVCVVAGFMIYRSVQRQRMLNLRLSLARNFHDEIGPMLLYANTLAKKEMEANGSVRLEELKNQIMYVMEAVRGISHDLKSNELSTVHTFQKEIAAAWEKIRTSTGIDLTIRINAGNKVLSHMQSTHLRKIVDELVSNSIRHGECSQINLQIKTQDHRLLLHYSDNGKGIAPDRPAGGIGMQNMLERTNLLNGEFVINNAWPDGYSIDISIPLL